MADDDPTTWTTGRLLSAAARRVERSWDEHLERWQLTHGSFPVLALLAGGDHSQRELAGAMSVTDQTMSRMLARLERAGYVRRNPHDVDRRRRVVHLLPRGAAVLAAASDPRRVERMATRGLDEHQVAALRDALVAMLLAADADDRGPGGAHRPEAGHPDPRADLL